MFNTLISLHILLPVLGALLNVLCRRRLRAARVITTATLFALVASSSFILVLALQSNECSYSFGGWPAPFGIEFKITYYNALFLLLISVAALCSFLYGQGLLYREMEPSQITTFNALFLICTFGIYGLLMTNDFFNLYVFIEVNSLATYALVSWHPSNRKSLLAAFYYLIIGSVAAIFILIGIGYLYSASGTLNMSDVMSKFPSIKHLKTVHIGSCLIALGLLIKSAAFPLHSWLLKVYRETNAFILPFLGAASHKIYLFIFAKLFFLGLFDFPAMKYFLLPAGLLSIIIFSSGALFSKNLRAILTLSGLTQVGYVFIFLHLDYKLSFLLIVLQLASYGLTALTLFMLTVRFAEMRGSSSLEALGGITREAPLQLMLFIINAFSLIGFPTTVMFLPKFGLFLNLLHNKAWLSLAITVCTSFLTMLYLFRVINVFIFRTRPAGSGHQLTIRPQSFIELAVVAVLTITNLVIGFASLAYLKLFV
jgi:multicomponent Na+:H+ antiporter subunit D